VIEARIVLLCDAV